MAGYRLISILFAALLQHVVHEYGHVLMARIQGVRVLRIQWFTYSGCTKVFLEGEPGIGQERIETKWGLIGLGGLVGTTLIGYLLTLLFLWGPMPLSAWSVNLFFYGSVIFLVTDPIYFLLGALFGFGDMLGVAQVFHLSKPAAVLVSILPLVLAGFTIMQVWYR